MLSLEQLVRLCYFPEVVNQTFSYRDKQDLKYIEYFKTVTKDLNEKHYHAYTYMCGMGWLSTCSNFQSNTYARCLQVCRSISMKFETNGGFAALEIPEFNYLGICLVDRINCCQYQYGIRNGVLWVRAFSKEHTERSLLETVENRFFNHGTHWDVKTPRVKCEDPLKLNDPLYVQYIKPLVDNYVEHEEPDNINYFKRV